MDIQTLTRFFMWCTVINGVLLVLWSTMFILAPDFVYRTQSKWFPISRETYNVIMYSLIGSFKIIFIVFSVAPYIALVIVQ